MTNTHATQPDSSAALVGQTWHLLRGSKYAGVYSIDSAELVDNGPWIHIHHDGRGEWHTQLADCFPTEAEARAEGKARRKQRQAKQPVALYGDFAQLARFHGLRTDGTGRKA